MKCVCMCVTESKHAGHTRRINYFVEKKKKVMRPLSFWDEVWNEQRMCRRTEYRGNRDI